MNDEQTNANHAAKQWEAFQKIWGETFSKLMQLGFTFSPDSAPPEFIRQMRTGIFQALAQSWEHFLRSPQFMEGMKHWMDNALAFRKLSSDFFNKVRQETQTTSREDIDAVMLAMRHLETRVLDRVEELAAQVEEVKKCFKGASRRAPPASPTRREPKGRRGKSPRKK